MPADPVEQDDEDSGVSTKHDSARADAGKARDAHVDAQDAALEADDAATPAQGRDAGTKDAAVRDAGHASDAGTGGSDAGVSRSDAGSNVCDSLTYASFGKQFMQSYCVSCHGGLLAQKNVHLDTLAGVVSAKAQVKSDVSRGSMPPPGSNAPTSAERKQLSQWIDCGPK